MWLLDKLEIPKPGDTNEQRLVRRRKSPFSIFQVDDKQVEIGETENVYYMKIENKYWFATNLDIFKTFLRNKEDEENEWEDEDWFEDEEDFSDCSYESEKEDYETDNGTEFRD